MNLSVVTFYSVRTCVGVYGKGTKYVHDSIDAEYNLWFDLFESLCGINVGLAMVGFEFAHGTNLSSTPSGPKSAAALTQMQPELLQV